MTLGVIQQRTSLQVRLWHGKKGRANVTGEHYTHRYLCHAAESLADQGRVDDTGAPLIVAGMLFTYFAFEAYLTSSVSSYARMPTDDDRAGQRAI